MNKRFKLPKLIAIDLDGTLVDSVPDLHTSVNIMQQKMGGPLRSEQQVRNWVGNGVVRLVHRALTDSLGGEAESARFEAALQHFEQAYQRCNGVHSRLFAGVNEGLMMLETLACPLVCVTNKPARFTETLLSKLALRDYFELVLSGDSLPQQKPHPQPLLHAAKHFDVPAADCLMVGDSITDIKAARAADFTIACVSYGYNHGHDPAQLTGLLQPDAVIDGLDELPSCWSNHPPPFRPRVEHARVEHPRIDHFDGLHV